MAVAAGGLAAIGMAGGGSVTGMTTAGFLLTLCAAFSGSQRQHRHQADQLGECGEPGGVGRRHPASSVLPAVVLGFEGPEQIAHSLANISASSIGAIVCPLAPPFSVTACGAACWRDSFTRGQPGRAATLLVPVVGLVSAAVLLGERLCRPTGWAAPW